MSLSNLLSFPKGLKLSSNSTRTVHYNCINVDGENHTPTEWGEIVLHNHHLLKRSWNTYLAPYRFCRGE